MRRIVLVGAFIVMADGAAAQAPDWRRPDTDGKYYWVLVDARSIRPDADFGFMRFTSAHASGPGYRTAVPLGTARTQAAFDCKSGRYYTLRDGRWAAGGPGDMAGPVRDFVCRKR
ncbi:MAG: hypothetical protein K2Z80_30170 [Xanthobacteraceae bacterium]|nr:hypothetical protein [Xanthobacteraceae bacterium]